MQNNQSQYTQLKQKLELKQHELRLIEQRLQQTEHHRQQEEVNNLKKQMGMIKITYNFHKYSLLTFFRGIG